jgi:hypothetical protein
MPSPDNPGYPSPNADYAGTVVVVAAWLSGWVALIAALIVVSVR